MPSLRLLVGGVLVLHIIVLVWVAWGLPIGPSEAKTFFTSHSLTAVLMHGGRDLFPHGDFINIRLPFLVLHLINLYLFYRLTGRLLKDEVQRLSAFLIFLFLPGIISSAVLATSTGMILALYQGFLILYLTKRKIASYLILPLFLVIDKSSVIFYFALFTYALWQREIPLLALTTFLFGVSLQIYGIDIHGKPVNHFIDTIALYAAVFSPLLFLYFFYAIYRILLKGEKTIIWHIAFVVLILSLIISLRQRIPIQDFAPYVVVAIPLMVGLFFRSYKVRLPRFRKGYKLLALLVIGVLMLNAAIMLFHKPLFLWIEYPRRHFAAPFYLPYWCAQALEKEGIEAVRLPHRKEALQMRYYGIENRGPLRLSHRPMPNASKVTIRYKDHPIEDCYVSKINNLTDYETFHHAQRQP